MKAELAAMEEHGVFGSEEVKLLESPVGRKALPSHWVFKAKRDDSGNVTKFTARLVCGGNHQTDIKPNGRGGKGGVLRLYRSLYGLRQATNVFYDVFKSHLLNIAFVPSKVDAGFFFLYENKENLHATIVL